MIRFINLISILFVSGVLIAQNSDFRAPSYPLITHDPYFSIWINDEVPNHCESAHWTQKPMAIRSMIRIDGETYRLMGKSPAFIKVANHIHTELSATKTTFYFEQDGLKIELNFLSPLLVGDMDLVSRPLSYVSWNLESSDGKSHSADIYFDISGYACIHQKGQKVTWEKSSIQELQILKKGTQEQPVLKRKGDDVRIDWGYLYLSANSNEIQQSFIGRSEAAMVAFADGKDFPDENKADLDLRFINYMPVLATTMMTEIPNTGKVEKKVMVAYDDIYSVEYFHKKLEGYWKLKFETINDLLVTAENEYPEIKERCQNFDSELNKKAIQLGGEKYAAICALTHRQCMAAHKIVKDNNNQLLCFSKENFSNGAMGTVDVFYPASPYFLYLNPELMKAQTAPIFDYSESGRWPWPYAEIGFGLTNILKVLRLEYVQLLGDAYRNSDFTDKSGIRFRAEKSFQGWQQCYFKISTNSSADILSSVFLISETILAFQSEYDRVFKDFRNIVLLF